MILDQYSLPEEQIAQLLSNYSNNQEEVEYKPDTRRASVLVPLFMDDEWKLLFTRRTETVMFHKGQVAFPGGGAEENDPDVIATALREANEEIGLHPSNVKVLGKLKHMVTTTNYFITPVVAIIQWPFSPKIQKREVSRIFSIPLEWLSDPRNLEIHQMMLPDGTFHPVYYYKPFSGETLWGISARITVDLLVVLGLIDKKTAVLL